MSDNNTDTRLHGLVELANKGDREAKALLIDHACDRLLALTRKHFRRFPSLQRWEQTDDVFQNSLIRLHRALGAVQLESVRHFFNLAGEQVRRELLDLKKHYYGTFGPAENHHTDLQPPDEAGGTISKHAAQPDDLEQWTVFHASVERLPKDEREAFNLLYYEGLSQDEAARVLGLSTRTMKRRWQAAKLKLEQLLRGESG